MNSQPRSMFNCCFLTLFVFAVFMISTIPALALSHEKMNLNIVDQAPLGYQHTITLITGDRLYLSKNGKDQWAIAIKPVKRPYGNVPFSWHKDDTKGYYIIPSDVLHLIPDTLDSLFFNIDYLMENEMDDGVPLISVIAQTDNAGGFIKAAKGAGIKTRLLHTINSSAVVIAKKKLRNQSSGLWHFENGRMVPKIPHIRKLFMNRHFHVLVDKAVTAAGGDVAYRKLGYNGENVNIAILDTGVDTTHPDFSLKNGQSKVSVNKDYTCFTSNRSNICDGTPVDLNGHGTHVASIALGTGAGSSGKYKGMAPMAKLLNIKVLNRYGIGFESDIIRGLEVAAYGTNYIRGDEPDIEADVISMSLGMPSVFEGTDLAVEAVNTIAKACDLPIVIAAGDSGYKGHFSVYTPGVAENAITVGASAKNFPFAMGNSSSLGPTPWSFELKPDIVAPGVDIMAACSSKASELNCSTEKPYISFSGTSSAAPVIAGTLALLIQKSRNLKSPLTALQLKDLLQSTAKIIKPVSSHDMAMNVYTQGAGILKVDHALTHDLIISPAHMSFGLIDYDQKNLDKEIRLTNKGDKADTITLSWELSDVMTASHSLMSGSQLDGAISLSETTLLLGPGETATVKLHIDLSRLPIPATWQSYSGFVHAKGSNGVTAHAILGFTRKGQYHELSIRGMMPDGKPPQHAIVQVVDATSGQGYLQDSLGYVLNSEGKAFVSVPSGVYHLILTIFEWGKSPSIRRVTHNDFKVDGEKADVVIDAGSAKPVVLNILSDPLPSECLQQGSDYFFNRTDGSIYGTGWNLAGRCLDHFSVYSNHAPLNGSLKIINRWLKSQKPLEKSPVLFDWIDIQNEDRPYVLKVTHEDLKAQGQAVVSYHSDLKLMGAYARFSSPAISKYRKSPILSGIFPISLPMIRKEFYVAEKGIYSAILWPKKDVPYLFQSKHVTAVDGQIALGQQWHRGELEVQRWMERPLTPRLMTVAREKNHLSISGYSLTDGFGHGGKRTYKNLPFTLSVFLDGKIVAITNEMLKPLIVDLFSEDVDVTIAIETATDAFWSSPPLNIASKYHFKSTSMYNGMISIPQTYYRVMGLDIENRILLNKGRHFSFNIDFNSTTDETVKLEKVLVKLSLDDGYTWVKPEDVEINPFGIGVKYSVPGELSGLKAVSIKLDAVTSDGIEISEIIKRACIIQIP